MTTVVANPSGRKSAKDKKANPNKNVSAPAIVTTNNVNENINNHTEDFRNKSDKFQPTAEQMRIASLMSDKKDENDLKPKIDQIVELTGASRDDAAVALFDCDNDMDKAVEMILDGDSLDSEWQSTGRKKKIKSQTVNQPSAEMITNGNRKAEKSLRSNNKNNVGSNSPQGNSAKGSRGGPAGANKVPRKKDVRPNDSKLETGEEGDIFAKAFNTSGEPARRGVRRGGPGGGRGSRGAPRGAKGGPMVGGRGSRTFMNRGLQGDGFPNSIETWSNSTAEQSKSNNDDLNTMTVGNWSDIAANEDWSEEDWTAEPMETKVFTPSTKTIPEKDESEPEPIKTTITGNPSNSQPLPFQPSKSESQETAPPTMSAILSGSIKRSSPASANAGQALLQQIQQSNAPQNSNLNQYRLSQYSKQATESIKSLVGLTSNNILPNDLIPTSDHSLENNLSQVSKPPTQPQNQQNRRPNIPNQRAKIPESAVEMPSNDPISNLSVHFGTLEFGTNSFSIGANDSNIFDAVTQNANTKPESKNISLLSSTTDPSNNSNANFRSANNNVTQANKSMLQSPVLPQMLNDSILNSEHRNDKPLSTNNYNPAKPQINKNDYMSYKGTYVSNDNAYASTYQASVPSNVGYYSSTNQMTPFGNAGPISQSLMANHAYNSTYNASNNATNNVSNVSKIRDTDNSVQQQQHQVSASSVSASSKPYEASSNVGSSLSLMSNSTVTTNALKNTLSATGKGVHNVPPGVQPTQVLSAPYITAGMPIPYPYTYDGQFPTMARDHGYPYATTDVKYNRGSESDMLPVSSQAAGVVQTATQAHNQPYMNTYPPGYGFYFGQVNFAQPGIYNPHHLYPVPQAQTTASAGSAFAKANNAASYGSHSYNSGYDSLGANVQTQDYVNKAYPQQMQQHKQLSGTTTGDLSAANNPQSIYNKPHSQINKSYEKQTFQQTTQFNLTNQTASGNLSSAYGAPYQLLPQQMHHLSSAEQTQQPHSVSNQRSLSQTQKGSSTNNPSYGKFNWS